jgi:hypothetical protein
MNTHPYLRAYLAGVLVPTLVLPLVLAAFILVRLVLKMPVPVEQVLIFPMAVVPTLWGLWNIVWLASHPRTHLPLGLHGCLLVVLLMPVSAVMATFLGVLDLGGHGATWFKTLEVPYALITPCFLAVLAGYYLVWKYIVGFANRVLGVA